MAQIDRSVRRSAMIGGQVEVFDRGRPLGDVVDEAAGRGNAALHAGNALEKLDALLVFKRNILLAGDGHAVDLKPGGQIERKAANLVEAVVAHGHVIVRRRKRRC